MKYYENIPKNIYKCNFCGSEIVTTHFNQYITEHKCRRGCLDFNCLINLDIPEVYYYNIEFCKQSIRSSSSSSYTVYYDYRTKNSYSSFYEPDINLSFFVPIKINDLLNISFEDFVNKLKTYNTFS